VQIAGVDTPGSPRRKFGVARRRRPDKNLLAEREKEKKKERGKRFGVEVAEYQPPGYTAGRQKRSS